MPATLLRAPSRDSDSVVLSLRSADDGEIIHIPPWMLTPSLMADTQPFRKFRSYKDQQHYSGTYWSSTESSHVIYESRLELSRLVIADFDPTIERIFAQPLMIRARIDERARRHIPDFLLIRGADLTFVAVKPRDRLDEPKVAETLAWVGEVVESCGWGFEVASEPAQPFFDNVRFLAGYRRKHMISAEALAQLRAMTLPGMTFGEAVRRASAPEPLVRAALLHLLWTHEARTDLSLVLSDKALLTSGGRK
ncbi:TnsA-like heteromeric transposase endonuclease subunit [Mycobacterium intracellulare]|uniref:TnsA-like heteromeric transposase endonuclease subunit n=1 Tax=Mycobacterium intracellulare TaxID=1767 RepID=UPI001E437CAA|nr:TnsA-like heteromeric transposase endonuclease subunit [Mycobacterium intracellulare]